MRWRASWVPDRIKRTVQVAHPPHTVWTALTTAEGLGAWFGDEATIDLRPGGAAPDAVGERAHGADAAERVEEPVVFGFTCPIYGLPEQESLGLMAMLVALGVMSITWMAVIALAQ